MKITAAVTRSPGAPMTLEQLDLEAPQAGEILVKIVAVGVCHTDMVMRDQHIPVPLPAVMGHEASGIVEALGAGVHKVAVGDHVVLSFNSCGECPSCRDHQPAYCYDFFGRNFGGRRPDGSSALSRECTAVSGNVFGQSSFATHALCHEANVVKVRNDAPLRLLGPLGCGIQTGAGAVMNALKVRPGSSFLVFGAGSVGLSAIMAAKLMGAAFIFAADLKPARREIALELGATHAFDPTLGDMESQIAQLVPAGLDYVLDTTGIPAVITGAIKLLAPRGVCGLVGAAAPGATSSFDLTHVMSAGRVIRGIVEGESDIDNFIPKLVELYMEGRFPFDRLVRYYPFDAIEQAIHDSETGVAIKPILLMPD